MNEVNIKRITTDDTKKTYEFVNQKPTGDFPQLWRMEVYISALEKSGQYIPRTVTTPFRVLIVERQTLVDRGFLPPSTSDDKPPEKPSETLEDLILRLLDMVGVRPND
jgi:cytochrome oxidase assembly protein ShyY1